MWMFETETVEQIGSISMHKWYTSKFSKDPSPFQSSDQFFWTAPLVRALLVKISMTWRVLQVSTRPFWDERSTELAMMIFYVLKKNKLLDDLIMLYLPFFTFLSDQIWLCFNWIQLRDLSDETPATFSFMSSSLSTSWQKRWTSMETRSVLLYNRLWSTIIQCITKISLISQHIFELLWYQDQSRSQHNLTWNKTSTYDVTPQSYHVSPGSWSFWAHAAPRSSTALGESLEVAGGQQFKAQNYKVSCF